jgi:endonuclease-3
MTLKERYEGVINYFKTNVPVAETELNYSNPFELIISVILSAQCTDKRINQVTPRLFQDFPTAEALAASNSDTIFSYIRSVSYPNNKAKHLVNMANMLLKDFNGIIPSEIEDLVKLPGVGRKTANVVASVIYDKPAMAVDTHVFRVSNRLGLTKAKTPLQSEQQLIKYIPEKYVATAHHWLILHGRYTCLARTPKCDICPLTEWCNYFKINYLKNKPTKVSTTKKAKVATLAIKVKTVSEKATIKQEKKSDEKFIPHSTSLKVGDKAPTFKAKDQHGNTITLADFKGKNVVLYFYPKDSTPTCTIEACNLRDEYKLFSKKNLVVLGVSADDEKMHLKFATKNDLPFSLLADTDMAVIKAYDVWGTKQFMGRIFDGILRTTFVIDEKGIIKQVITKVKSKEHGKQILELV